MAADLLIPFYAQAPLRPVRALGSTVWDSEGRDYLDLAGGIAVCSLGHSHPQLREVLIQQAEQLWHISNFYAAEPTLQLAAALTEATFADRVFFANSGSEAIEAAIKLARGYFFSRGEKARNRILCFSGAFHGRTTLAIALGDKASHREGFGPLPEGIDRLPFNDVAALKQVQTDNLAAVLLEPVQGEAGVIAASQDFLQQLRKLCDRTGSLLIFDEVQSGNARTGPLFAYMDSGVVPDILATAKGLGGGLPIGAVLTRKAIAAAMKPGMHGSTFGGNPLICAVALHILQLIQGADIRTNIDLRSRQMAAGLARIAGRTGLFGEVRIRGLWAGASILPPWAGRVAELLDCCRGAGVLALPAGDGDVLRLAPALNITEDELAAGLERLGQGCDDFLAAAGKP